MIKDYKPEIREMLKAFFPLLFAVGLQQLLALLVNLIDNFMLGQYAEAAMSGATAVNQYQFILQQVVFGVGGGVSVLASQYWGKKQVEPIKKIFSVGIKIGFVIGAVFTIVTALIPSQVVSLITNDPEIIAQGAEYMSIICFTYVLFSISMVLLFTLQGVQTAFIGTLMAGTTVIINFCLNYVLIFGNFGAPRLGVKGAAYATLTSRVAELVIILIYVLFIDKKLRLRIKDFFRVKTGYFKDYIVVAAPMMASGALWGVANAAQMAILGHLGAVSIGANSIATIIFQIFSVFGRSCANASSVIIGKTVGSKKLHLIRPYAKTLQLVYIAFGVASAALMFIFRDAIVAFYNISPETKEMAVVFITIMCITMIGTIYEYPVMGGIISGGGDTKYQAIIDIVFMWVLVIPLSALSAFVFQWGPIVTFICLKCDQILKCIPNAIYVNTYKWIKDRTRSGNQAEEDLAEAKEQLAEKMLLAEEELPTETFLETAEESESSD